MVIQFADKKWGYRKLAFLEFPSSYGWERPTCRSETRLVGTLNNGAQHHSLGHRVTASSLFSRQTLGNRLSQSQSHVPDTTTENAKLRDQIS
jgi:hypothetical protein